MGLFLAFLTVGAIAIAVWAETRFDGLGPRSFLGALSHFAIALTAGWILVPVALKAAVAAGVPQLVALFTIPFPALIYMSIAALWLVKLTHALMLPRHPHDAS
jgi:hypothetical protein